MASILDQLELATKVKRTPWFVKSKSGNAYEIARRTKNGDLIRWKLILIKQGEYKIEIPNRANIPHTSTYVFKDYIEEKTIYSRVINESIIIFLNKASLWRGVINKDFLQINYKNKKIMVSAKKQKEVEGRLFRLTGLQPSYNKDMIDAVNKINK